MYKSNIWNSDIPQAPPSPFPQASLEDGELFLPAGKDILIADMNTPPVEFSQATSYSNQEIQLHSHPFFELIYCRGSAPAEYLVNTQRYKLHKGDLVLIPPGVSHRAILPAQDPLPFTRDLLWISQELLLSLQPIQPELLPQLLRVPMLLRTAGTRWDSLGELFHFGVLEAQTRPMNWKMNLLAQSLLILTCVSRACADPMAQPLRAEKPELLDQMLSYVEQHLSEKITMADISRHFFISESTITQTFRRKMGVSFYRCVTQRRLLAAKDLIDRGLPLESVAEQVGFSDYSSFFRAFKQEFSMSPRQYRKLHVTGDDR